MIRLVELSEKLQLDAEQLTPAQAYSAIRESVPTDDFLCPVLEELKVPLAAFVQCSGFGAWMPTDVFYEHFDSVLQTLRFNKPELAVKG